MSIVKLKSKFDSLLNRLNGASVTKFSSTVESAYEALVLAEVMTEYKRIKGTINTITVPVAGSFLNQSPGKFNLNKSFKIEFANRESFYFAADVEVWGLAALEQNSRVGVLFEADVVVIPEYHALDVINNFDGYPAPQHLDSVYECKFGKYSKNQLRELLGLRRHISYLAGRSMTHANNHDSHKLFNFQTLNAEPGIPLKMVRPVRRTFFDLDTASLYDLQEVVV